MVTITEEKKARKINIDWGRQGGAVMGYIVIILGYFGVIANTMMYNDFGNWISFVDMDRTILFWTYQTYISAILDPVVFILIIVVLTALLIVFSIIDWHSYIIVLILIPIYILFVLDLFMNLFDIMTVLDTGTFYFTMPGLSLVLLFLICFALTYKEDIPQYGIKASLWMVPLLIALAFIFYTIMFGVSAESFILQFGSGEGYVNILILSLTVIAGSLSGMRIKKETLIRKEQFELAS
jgi:hypothetical protein